MTIIDGHRETITNKLCGQDCTHEGNHIVQLASELQHDHNQGYSHARKAAEHGHRSHHCKDARIHLCRTMLPEELQIDVEGPQPNGAPKRGADVERWYEEARRDHCPKRDGSLRQADNGREEERRLQPRARGESMRGGRIAQAQVSAKGVGACLEEPVDDFYHRHAEEVREGIIQGCRDGCDDHGLRDVQYARAYGQRGGALRTLVAETARGRQCHAPQDDGRQPPQDPLLPIRGQHPEHALVRTRTPPLREAQIQPNEEAADEAADDPQEQEQRNLPDLPLLSRTVGGGGECEDRELVRAVDIPALQHEARGEAPRKRQQERALAQGVHGAKLFDGEEHSAHGSPEGRGHPGGGADAQDLVEGDAARERPQHPAGVPDEVGPADADLDEGALLPQRQPGAHHQGEPHRLHEEAGRGEARGDGEARDRRLHVRDAAAPGGGGIGVHEQGGEAREAHGGRQVDGEGSGEPLLPRDPVGRPGSPRHRGPRRGLQGEGGRLAPVRRVVDVLRAAAAAAPVAEREASAGSEAQVAQEVAARGDVDARGGREHTNEHCECPGNDSIHPQQQQGATRSWPWISVSEQKASRVPWCCTSSFR
mmetsp:Transcript_90224/g.263878  ORF Transcript_90224/g.263878 Transcript_90224/m.263878 type:complete len:595 (-) Transcript_90224:78-1862(-)